jgi:hypothetical protein
MSGLAKRTIDGKVYTHYGGFRNKSDAEKLAAKVKSQGAQSVRIIPFQGDSMEKGSSRMVTWYGVWAR